MHPDSLGDQFAAYGLQTYTGELCRHIKPLSRKRKCELLKVNRSRLYYKPLPVPVSEVDLMNELRDIYEEWPVYGYRKMHAVLRRRGYKHSRNKTHRLMQLAGLRAIYQKKKTTIRNMTHKVYPYLLRGMIIDRPNQVWAVDITYISHKGGFVYLVALIDIYSRKIMGWALSPFLDTNVCVRALQEALKKGRPEIINSDQGCQFTSQEWILLLQSHGIQVSMDGKGRWVDNKYIERLWRTIKYEFLRLYSFANVPELHRALAGYLEKYNQVRLHAALDYKTPAEVFDEFFNHAERLQYDPVIPFDVQPAFSY